MVGEGEELPLPSNISRKCQIVEVLQDRPDVAVGGFDHEADGEVCLRVKALSMGGVQARDLPGPCSASVRRSKKPLRNRR